VARWLIEIGGVKLTVKASKGPAKELVELALSAIDTEKVTTAQGIKLSVRYDDDSWEVCDHSSNLTRKLVETGDVIYHLTDRIVFHVADKASDMHCLHAASVSRKNRALVIPANSGAGKSTFTTWLVSNGFDYLTDELILVDDDAYIEGIARPIQIKSNGLDAVSHMISNDDLVKKGKFANALPVASLNGSSVGRYKQKVALFVFPKFTKGEAYQATRLSSAEAGMRLMANHVNGRNLDGHGFRAMMKIIRETPCYSLEYGGFDTLPPNFSSLIDKLLQP
jgi:hypothetical protein